MEGWIKLHRKFLEWEWFNTDYMVKLFIFLLLNSNHKDSTWQGIEIKRGQYLTGLNSLSEKTKISIQTLRTCLKRLEKTKEINMQVTNKYRIITVCNYDSYQDIQEATNKQPNKQLTSKQQTTNKQLTTNKNEKNEKNVKNDNKIYRKFAHLKISIIEFNKLTEKFSKDQVETVLNKIENYKKNKNYTSLYLTALNWLKNEQTANLKSNEFQIEQKYYDWYPKR